MNAGCPFYSPLNSENIVPNLPSRPHKVDIPLWGIKDQTDCFGVCYSLDYRKQLSVLALFVFPLYNVTKSARVPKAISINTQN
jgi:hypothetical protein